MRRHKESMLLLAKHFNKYGNSSHIQGVIKAMEKIQIDDALPVGLTKYEVINMFYYYFWFVSFFWKFLFTPHPCSTRLEHPCHGLNMIYYIMWFYFVFRYVRPFILKFGNWLKFESCWDLWFYLNIL